MTWGKGAAFWGAPACQESAEFTSHREMALEVACHGGQVRALTVWGRPGILLGDRARNALVGGLGKHIRVLSSQGAGQAFSAPQASASRQCCSRFGGQQRGAAVSLPGLSPTGSGQGFSVKFARWTGSQDHEVVPTCRSNVPHHCHALGASALSHPFLT